MFWNFGRLNVKWEEKSAQNEEIYCKNQYSFIINIASFLNVHKGVALSQSKLYISGVGVGCSCLVYGMPFTG